MSCSRHPAAAGGHGRLPRPRTVRSPSPGSLGPSSSIQLTPASRSTLPRPCSAIVFTREEERELCPPRPSIHTTNIDRTIGHSRSFLGLSSREGNPRGLNVLISWYVWPSIYAWPAFTNRLQLCLPFFAIPSQDLSAGVVPLSSIDHPLAPQPEFHPRRSHFCPSAHLHRSFCISLIRI